MDKPFYEILEEMDAHIMSGEATVFGKWTCAGCGARQMFDTPNVMHLTGLCEECGHETSLVERGCGYLLLTGRKHREAALAMESQMKGTT